MTHTNSANKHSPTTPQHTKYLRLLVGILRFERRVWLGVAFACALLVALAHYGFQVYGFMPPCEQCVYIRYAFCVIVIGASIAAINPTRLYVRLVGYGLMLYGSISGVLDSITLQAIHTAAHSDEMIFGVGGCSSVPKFDFNLPLHLWFPSLFSPSGDCGFDAPIVPSGVVLSDLQTAFVRLYENGWYLIPSAEFGTMAQCTLVIFILCIMLVVCAFSARLYMRLVRL